MTSRHGCRRKFSDEDHAAGKTREERLAWRRDISVCAASNRCGHSYMFSDRRTHALHNDINSPARKELLFAQRCQSPGTQRTCHCTTTSSLRRAKNFVFAQRRQSHGEKILRFQLGTSTDKHFRAQTANVKIKAETMSDPDRISVRSTREPENIYLPLTKTAHTVKSKRCI